MSGMGAQQYMGIIGGAAAHIQEMIGELSPAAVAQRKEFQKARNRLRTGQYGFSEAQKQKEQATGNREVQAQAQQQQADIARMQAGGALAGGAATEAQRAVAQQQAAGAAQVAQGVQAASNNAAQQQHINDQNAVAAQADHARQFWQRQAAISQSTTQGNSIGQSEMGTAQKKDKRTDPNVIQGNPEPTSSISAEGVK